MFAPTQAPTPTPAPTTMRFTGIFTFVEPTYGFFKNVRALDGGKVRPILADVFVRATTFVEALGKGRHSLERLDGQSFSFQTRESTLYLYHGKVEACAIRELDSCQT
ncbi:hypothetical protein A3A37_01720 [Candidatus Kaiserbacteria bacterium RIFCSPLOWO2_01_FULL_52_36]|nr:MAG: hypothetical protein A3A37_01720 [Candidatus Kaiserbacteria bacterium RIFCSPLOWO2_01_FULL_52_36]